MNKKALPAKKRKAKAKVKAPKKLINRELSWLSFNARVLQEAEDPSVPLVERIKFLGIFSNNMDEFFRVRVAGIKRIAQTKQLPVEERKNAKNLLEAIKKKVMEQQQNFDLIYRSKILPELSKHNIIILDETTTKDADLKTIRQHFVTAVSQKLFPLILDEARELPNLKDGEIYLAVHMSNSQTGDVKYALVQVPSKILGRFYILPLKHEKTRIILLDDIIRCSLDLIFNSLDFDTFTAHTIKITRDAELDFDSDIAVTLLEKVEKSLKQRKIGAPTRFIYDEKIPEDMLEFLTRKLKIDKESSIPGGKYHNFRDFIKFPAVGGKELRYHSIAPHRVHELDKAKSILNEVEKHDILLSYPYQPFDYIIRLLREAAIDPTVFAIQISLYRLAENSSIAEALSNAVHNGKQVTVVMELRARFMEEHNINWANKLHEEGAFVIYGIPNFKVHSKLIVISRRRNFKTSHIVHIGTGNFNEDTARLYCDYSLLTSRKRIATECLKVFEMISNFKPEKYQFNNLWVSPVSTRSNFEKFLNREIAHAKKGLPARAIIKINSLVDTGAIQSIRKAAKAGVKIDLIIRGMCCLPLDKDDPNIRAISIIDKYLEHARVYYFENAGKPDVFIGSADLMQRNIEYRVEVITPVFDKNQKLQLIEMLETQLKDNVKARILDSEMNNHFVKHNTDEAVRTQDEFYHLIKSV
ncbi:MAG: polyphosphate kinase 1 [Bacteroidia bacterium]|nr:polyphosphate kinase 1 [Bacteroidia bacterium]